MNKYLEKQALFPALITKAPASDLQIIVTIPACNELNLISSLESLKACAAPDFAVEVLVLINHSEKAAAQIVTQNQTTYEAAKDWANKNSDEKLSFFIFQKTLPAKDAGVGLARKILMDEAVVRFDQLKRPEGIIVCFDADSHCETNYLEEIFNGFAAAEKGQACSIHYEHPLEGDEFEPAIYEAIAGYELHLRYYVHAQKMAGFPFATQTIGSAMAVRSLAYQQQSGMNRRKAGEDFYFLHKFTPLGHFFEIKNTMVIPSPRISDRVPFGTGKAIGDLLSTQNQQETYHPEAFVELRTFFESVDKLYLQTDQGLTNFYLQQSKGVRAFLETVRFEQKVKEIKKNTSTLAAFRNRFFRWFNAFMLMKYMHYMRDHFYANIAVDVAAKWLLENYYKKEMVPDSAKELLLIYRRIDRG